MATPAPSDADLSRLLPVLTTDVLVHHLDLARAVGVDPQLDPELCRSPMRSFSPTMSG